MIVNHICVNFGASLFQEFFQALDACRLEQNVFYPRNKKHRVIDFETSYRINSPEVLNQLTKVFFSKKRQVMQHKYDPLFHNNKPDIIHAHTLFSDGSLAYYYSRSYGTPYIVAVRSTDIAYFLKYKPWLKSYGKKILDRARYIVFISPSLKKRFNQIYGNGYESKSTIIPNGINQFYLNQGDLHEKTLHTPPELLYVGSFLKRKNVPALISLLENSETKLTIAGEGGRNEKRVLKLIENNERVNYAGHIEDQSRLVQIYKQSDIFIMASRGETFGLVYLEAMSQGLPVVYSKNTGIDGFFEQGTIGYGVSPGSISEMVKAFEKIISDYKNISNNCINEARNFNWASIAEKYHSLYNKIISSSVPGQL